MKPSVILFDVNETLLNMSPLKKRVNAILGSKRGFRIWFGMLLQYSLVDNSTGQYHDFTTIASATLDMAARALDTTIDKEKKEKTLAIIRVLPAYGEVPKGLNLLKDAGFRLATLTNSPKETLTAQLEYAGLTKFFDAMLSIDTIQKYKPAPETYHYAAHALEVNINEILMVAAHGWDIAGALEAGMQTCFIERKGQSLYNLSPLPGFIGSDLIEVAKKLIG